MQKLYYSISEVCSIVDEEQHILRYWEKEFEGLRPKKNRGGNRIYSEKDLKIVEVIKILIREEMLSLKGAKEQLKKIFETQNIENYLKTREKNKSVSMPRSKQDNTDAKDEYIKINKQVFRDITNVLKENLDYLKSI